MQTFLSRLRALPRWQFLTGVSVLVLLVVVLTGIVLSAPGTSAPGSGHGTSAVTGSGRNGTPTVAATGTQASANGTATPPSATATGTPAASPTAPVATGGLIDTYANIHLGLAFDTYVSDLNSLQGKVDLVWGANSAQSVPGAFTISYNPSERIGNGDNGPLYSIDWFKQNHPDWIVYKCDQTTPAYGFGEPNTPLDITNPAVLQFLMNQQFIPQITAGYKGIGFDNIGYANTWERCGHFDKNGKWVQLYSGLIHDPQYQNSIITWGKTVYAMIKHYNASIKVAMNFSFDYQNWGFWSQMLPYVDIVADEGGFTHFGNPNFPYIVGDEWNSYVSFLQQLQGQGKGLFVFDQEPSSQISSDQMEWALANYLLIKEHATYLTVVGQQQYGQFYDHPEYHAAIGTPQGDMTQAGCAYQRAYSGGFVAVNPAYATSCAVTLPHAFKTLSGATVTSLNLPAHAGAVLLNP